MVLAEAMSWPEAVAYSVLAICVFGFLAFLVWRAGKD